MPQQQPTPRALGIVEFVALTAVLTALDALSIDTMLPALSTMGADLGVAGRNDTQLVVGMLFLGTAFGQVVAGPASDSLGRKRALYGAIVVYLLGSVVCLLSANFTQMLVGRFVQGFGAAGPVVVVTALIRDLYEGRAMARIMSFSLAVFILVPVMAPLLGQGILLVAHWRFIFLLFLVLALIVLVWFSLRQPETLPPERRVPFSVAGLGRSFRLVLGNKVALAYGVVQGLSSGAFLGYLSSAQAIFQDEYAQGTRFPLFFASFAASIGIASVLNGRLVQRLGMQRLTAVGLAVVSLAAFAMLPLALATEGQPPLPLVAAWLAVTLFCYGILFGNIGALQMEHLGEAAGVGASVLGSLGLFLAVPIGAVVGQAYDHSIVPLALGFASMNALALSVMAWAERTRALEEHQTAADMGVPEAGPDSPMV